MREGRVGANVGAEDGTKTGARMEGRNDVGGEEDGLDESEVGI